VSDAAWNETIDGADGTLPIHPFEGPDLASGYGLVDAKAAVEAAQNRLALESTIENTCETKTFELHVPAGVMDPVKVTLAWDDPASDAPEVSTDPRLINDLDLVLIDPSGTKHYPWLLDQTPVDETSAPLPDASQTCGMNVYMQRVLMPNLDPWFPGVDASTGVPLPGTPRDDPINDADIVAAGRGKDHLNNLEQVVAPAMSGIWTVEVSGFLIRQGPQRFSLIGVPGKGVIPLAPPKGTLCKMAGGFCEVRFAQLCARYPKICEHRPPIPFADTFMELTFDRPADRKVIEASTLCFQLTSCAPTLNRRGPFRLDLELTANAQGVGIELFDAAGVAIAADLSSSSAKRLMAPATRGPVFIVLRPLGRVSPDSVQRIPVALTRRQ
jgi:hypothetical protein